MQAIRINVTNFFVRLFVSIFVPDCHFESHRLPHTLLAFHYLTRSPESHPTVLPFAVPLQAARGWGCDRCALPGTAPRHPVTAVREWEPGVDHLYIVQPTFRPRFLYAKSPFRKTPESQ